MLHIVSPVKCITYVALLFLLISCQNSSDPQDTSTTNDKLFTSVNANYSGVDFKNTLIETTASNYFKYMYSYIGGGVATADFNNDGLEDLFFISNQQPNKLYLNQGELKFEDVTDKAGVVHRKGFDAGVAIADVNNDGWLDIYVSRGGWIQEDNAFNNLLFINQGSNEDGIPTFVEKAESYGLADGNRAIQSTFFDYDKDGDLDVYISNAPDFDDPAADIVDLIAVQTDPKTLDMKGSDQLYQNNGDQTFTNVSVRAGIMPDIGFGLNPQVGDLNNDGWPDLYICNDFRIPDFLYINNTDGTFREGRNELLNHMSFNSMGGDIADVNNDGFMDIFTLDMNPEDYIRSKTTMGMTSQSRFEEMVAKDYHHQYMHNMLQLNTGDNAYSEISKLAGIADSDWSWSCLFADFDLDGHNDIYITNGVYRDVIDRDANNQILTELRAKNRKPTDEDFLSYAKMLPQQKLVNYIFRNQGDLSFDNVSSEWSDAIPTFSNGAAYADLDNDGDLEVVVNNINQEATILKNNTIEKGQGAYLSFKVKGPKQNLDGQGVIVKLELSDDVVISRQLIRSRGFLSSVSGILHFGIPNDAITITAKILWPDGKQQILNNLSPNQLITVDHKDAQVPSAQNEVTTKPIFQKLPLSLAHIDPSYDDYQKQILLPHKLSQLGPAIAVGDVNKDGIEDIYIGGGHAQAGELLLGSKNNLFKKKPSPSFERDKQKEDVDASFFDADNDGDLDLYVVSGSYEFGDRPRLLFDRLYINDGNGNMKKSSGVIPEFAAAGSVVRPADFDKDGDIDLFVGSRVVPGHYPIAPVNYILQNNNGAFTIQTNLIAPELENLGMVTDAHWEDMDADGDLDIILAGEWMGVTVMTNTDNKFNLSSDYNSLSDKKGWWNNIEVADIDADGDIDIIAGNLGLNAKFQASEEKPFHVYTDDFDFNGTTDIFLATDYKDQEVPVRGKTCATQQLPHLANKIKSYNDFASSSLSDILGPRIKSALHLEATEFRSGIFVNDGSNNFAFSPFPNSVQRSPVNSIIYDDLDKDGVNDLLLAGNNHMPEIETTRYDAGVGTFLSGSKDGQFFIKPNKTTGFTANKDVRHLQNVKGLKDGIIVVINNNDEHTFYKY